MTKPIVLVAILTVALAAHAADPSPKLAHGAEAAASKRETRDCGQNGIAPAAATRSVALASTAEPRRFEFVCRRTRSGRQPVAARWSSAGRLRATRPAPTAAAQRGQARCGNVERSSNGASQPQHELTIDLDGVLAELRKDFPFRAGMTVEEVQKLFDDNNRRVEALMDDDFAKMKATGNLGPPLYADRDLHLYVYADLFGEASKTDHNARRFWVNGRYQFWVAMTIEKGMVKNIYITPGNLSVVLPSVLFDGQGEDVGWLPKIAKRTEQDQLGEEDNPILLRGLRKVPGDYSLPSGSEQ
jgi:hypothetical protein